MSEAKLNVKGIFFDLDGTIVDSREAYLEAARTAFQALGKETPDAKTALEIPRRLEQKQSLGDLVKGDVGKFLEVYLRAYYSVTAEKARPFPGVSAALETLSRKAKLALVTMRAVSRQTVIAELEHFGIARFFAHVVTALDSCEPKPSPEALISCVKALDVQMCDCVMVGDSVSDVRAGKAAGVLTVGVLSGLFSRGELVGVCPDLILRGVWVLPGFVV
jgi:HAD superfamily hydrolase (TIGR01509 family)